MCIDHQAILNIFVFFLVYDSSCPRTNVHEKSIRPIKLIKHLICVVSQLLYLPFTCFLFWLKLLTCRCVSMCVWVWWQIQFNNYRSVWDHQIWNFFFNDYKSFLDVPMFFFFWLEAIFIGTQKSFVSAVINICVFFVVAEPINLLINRSFAQIVRCH